MSLPELFAAFERDEAASFPALQGHQTWPWHVFLVQLACHCLEIAIANEKTQLPEPDPARPWELVGVHTPEEWYDMIRAIVPDGAQLYPDDEPWCLVVDDWSKPAFMQVPVADADKKDYKGEAVHPDDLDLLVSSKNFDIKSGAVVSSIEDWVFALISLQTNAGFLGRGNYGCARQNGGWSCRPIFTLQSRTTPGSRWGRDARVILEHLHGGGSDDDEIYTVCENPDGTRLLWLEPWNGTHSLQPRDLHPLFIEISRRLRAQLRGGEVIFKKAASKTIRVDSSATCGDLKDPWEPTISDEKNVKVFGSKPDYANIARILANAKIKTSKSKEEKFNRPLLLRYHEGIDPLTGVSACCSAVMKGQGKTEEYIENTVPVDVEELIDTTSLWTAAQEMLTLIKNAKNSVLGVALAEYMSCGKSADGRGDVDWNSTPVKDWTAPIKDAMDKEAGEKLFQYIWNVSRMCGPNGEITDPAWLDPWKKVLKDLVRKYYELGVDSLPCSASQKIKARAIGDLTLNRRIKAELKLTTEEVNSNASGE